MGSFYGTFIGLMPLALMRPRAAAGIGTLPGAAAATGRRIEPYLRETAAPITAANDDTHEQLRQLSERWALMTTLASDYYWQTDAEHRLCPLQPELQRRLGAAAERLEGLTRWEAHPDALTPTAWAEHRADLDARRPFRSLHLEVQLGNAGFMWLSISGTPRYTPDGSFVGYHGFGRDITGRKEAERLMLRHNEALQQAVAERTRELQQVNVDLDAFARQLAHELRTPIGHVQGLAQLLDARIGAQLSDADRQLLTMQVQAAHQMRETVDALMVLARSTLQTMPLEPVDASALCRTVCADLAPLARSAPVDWQVQEGMRVMASPAALRIVLKNLLGNAAKFTRAVARPEVRVSLQASHEGRVCLSVQDNGAGFDMAQVGRLFTPFGRLHGGTDYPGTGIGLTIVQCIVERHGGSVKAFGEVGRGARFDVTLAAAPESGT